MLLGLLNFNSQLVKDDTGYRRYFCGFRASRTLATLFQNSVTGDGLESEKLVVAAMIKLHAMQFDVP